MKYFLTGMAAFLAGLLIGLWIAFQIPSKDKDHETPRIVVDVKTDTIRDTVRVPEPVLVDREKIRTDTVMVPLACEPSDSVAVQLPIEQRVYADSTYKAWVSGYEPSLDSIHVYPVNTVTTIKTAEVMTRRSRWEIGVTAGIGVTPEGAQPYVGFGITYSLFQW